MRNSKFIKYILKNIQENINLKIGLSFVAIFAVLMASILFVTSVIFKNIIESSENRLSENITNVLSISISRISFSGKYHAQIFSDQLIEKESSIKYIVIVNSEGEVISKSFQPQFSNFIENNFLKLLNKNTRKLSKTENIIKYVECCNNQSIKEITVPYNGSFDQGQIGYIIVGLSTLRTNKNIVRSTFFLIFLGTIVSVIGLLLIYVVTNKISYPIRRQATMFQGILNYAPMLVMIKDKNGHPLAVSKEYETKEELTKGHISQIFSSGSQYSYSTGKILKDIKTASGEVLTFLTLEFPLFDKLGKAYGLCSLATDVTDDQKNQKALLKSEFEFRSIFEASPVGIANIDTYGQVLRSNPALVKMLGYSSNELKTMNIDLITYSEDRGIGRDLWLDFLKGKVANIEVGIRFVRKDGQIVWTHISSTALRNAEGEFLQTVSLFENVTKMVESEEIKENLFLQEQAARLEAQRAVLIRDEFLSIASHELKTPLTVLMMQVQLLNRLIEQGRLQDLSKEKQLNLIHSSSQQLDRFSRLISDLLDVTRLSKGKLILNRVKINLYETVQNLLPRYQTELLEHGNSIILKGDHNVVGEWERLSVEQIIMNLVRNAIKFGPGLEIEITVERKGPMGVLIVTDHGIGISDEIQERIFECFERGVSSKSFGGLGLGLYISRQFIEAHGGTIKVISKLNEGSTFIVELPLISVEGNPIKS